MNELQRMSLLWYQHARRLEQLARVLEAQLPPPKGYRLKLRVRFRAQT